MNIGVRPAWGWYIRNAVGITLDEATLALDRSDGRLAIVVEASAGVTLHSVTAIRGTSVDYDVGVRPGCSGVVIVNSPGLVARNITAP